jgi:hypothetical protein
MLIAAIVIITIVVFALYRLKVVDSVTKRNLKWLGIILAIIFAIAILAMILSLAK